MKLMLSAGISAAAAATMTVAALAQQPSSGTSSESTTSAQQGQQVTVTGCVQRESDYRKARDAGSGGVAGTGVGSANEFVLVSASPSSGSSSTTGASGTAGTSGTTAPGATSAAAGDAYELTGPGEGKVASHLGRRVEITGRLKSAETTASGTPTGGATAGRPPSGVDVTSKDLQLRELEVSSVRETSGSCPSR